jgi:CDGSH-type Zn-finger protein
MARKVILKAKTPLQVGDKWICRCGLAKGWNEDEPMPFCDGSHKKARQEEDGKIYSYDLEGNLIESEEVYT